MIYLHYQIKKRGYLRFFYMVRVVGNHFAKLDISRQLVFYDIISIGANAMQVGQ